MDEQWSYVGKKSEQRWLWYAIDHATSTILATIFDRRKDEVFKQLKALLQPFNITRYYIDDWGAYERHLDTSKHQVGKRNTQKIERKNLNLRTWVKRLTRKITCFSKLVLMHDTVIGWWNLASIFMPNYRFNPLPVFSWLLKNLQRQL